MKHHNHKYNGTVPYVVGDRRYSQDRVLDFRALQDFIGAGVKDIINQLPCIVSGGVVTKGAGDTLDITLGRGYAKFEVEIPDDFSTIPPSKMSEDIEAIKIDWTAQNDMAIASAVLDGTTPNYVKVAYAEANGNTRDRAKSSGNYSYEVEPSFVITVDDTPPTDYEILLNTFTGTAGGAFIFLGTRSPMIAADDQSGWNPAGETWAYASADSPTFTLTIPTDKRTKYSKGMKLRLEQDQALTSYWSFDSDLTDGVGSNDGTAIGGAASGAGGKFSNGLTLTRTSSQAVSFTDGADFHLTGDFAIAGWIKSAYNGLSQMIFQSWSKNSNWAGIYVELTTDSKIQVITGDDTGTTANSDYTTLTGKTDTLDDGNFHYIEVTMRNNWMQIYVDGKLDASGYMISPAFSAGDNAVRLGCYCPDNSTNSLFFDGTLDDFFIIKGYALDEETIKDKYDLATAQGAGAITIQKKFLITDISYSAPNTTLTLYGGTDFALANAIISNPYFSIVQQPYKFNRNPDKWSVILEDYIDKAQATPTQNVWYSQLSVYFPIGKWKIQGNFSAYCYTVGVTSNMEVAISASNSSSTNLKLAKMTQNSLDGETPVFIESYIVLTVKTQHFIIIRTRATGMGSINILSSYSPLIVKATSVYI
jgi:hypothetical protein